MRTNLGQQGVGEVIIRGQSHFVINNLKYYAQSYITRKIVK